MIHPMRRTLARLRYLALHAPHKWPGLARLLWRAKLRSARALRRRGDTSALPPLVTLHVVNACNLRCVQCWEWGERGHYKSLDRRRLGDGLSTDEWRRIFRQLARWKPYLYFFGGEPLLRRDLAELVRSASRQGLLTALNSNATLLTRELAGELASAGLDLFIASLDGPREINDRIRLGRDVFRRVTAGIARLIDARRRLRSPFPVVEVCMTLTADNQDSILETAEIARELGADRFSLQLGSFTTEAAVAATSERTRRLFGTEARLLGGYLRDVSGIDGRRVEAQEKALLDGRLRCEYRRYPQRGLDRFDFHHYFRSPDRVFGEGVCHVPWKRAVILANGDLAACPGFPEVVLGNLTREPFADLWQNAAMGCFRRTLEEDGLFPACSRCCDLYELDESGGGG